MMAVYMIRAGADGPVKIGFAVDPTRRIGAVQTGAAERLTMLRVLDGDRGFESALHRHFAQLRTRGEWSTFDNEMLGDLEHLRVDGVRNKAVARIIDLLGGPTPIGRAMGVPSNTVGNWKGRGSIPARHHFALVRMSDGRLTPDMLATAHDRCACEPTPPSPADVAA